MKTCLITHPLRTKKYCTNYYIFSGVFGWWNLMKCLSPNALISLILPHYELFIEFESHGDNTLKMGKSNSSEKKKMKRPMFCPSLSRKSELRRKLTSLPWSESIATWATLISGKCARQVRSRKYLLYKQKLLRENKRKKKKKKGAKTRAKSDSNLTQLKFLIGKKK